MKCRCRLLQQVVRWRRSFALCLSPLGNLVDQLLLLRFQLRIQLLILHKLIFVDVWMFLETIPHSLELLYAIHAFGLLGREDEAGEGLSELGSARSMSHATKTWTVPVDFASLWVERGLLRCLLF